jgi:hypothetical protein
MRKAQPFEGKIEGLTIDPNDPSKVYFVIDDDDENTPSRIFHAVVSAEMLRAVVVAGGEDFRHRM